MKETIVNGRFWNPTDKRLWMSILFTSCVVLYAARMTMPITVSTVAKEYDWSKTDSGTVLSCFFWGYALTQVLGGHLSDQIGGERVLILSVTLWSLLTLITPEMISLFGEKSNKIWLIIIGRTLTGALQGVHFPAIASIVSSNLHSSEKTFFTSVVTSGPAVGMLLSGSLGSVLMEKYGWPYVFRAIGLIGLSWVLMLKYVVMGISNTSFYVPVPDSVILDNKPLAPPPPVPWFTLFKKAAFWSILIAHYTETNSFYILLNWLPTYFDETFPQGKGWVFNVVPWIISPLCSIFGGWLAERLIGKGWRVVIVRKMLEAFCQLSKAFLLLLISQFNNYTGALLCMALVVAAGGFHCSAVFMNPQDIAPQHAGSVFGIMNTVGSVPGFVGVYLTGYILHTSDSWSTVFSITALFNLLGCTAFLIFGTAKPILSTPVQKL